MFAKLATVIVVLGAMFGALLVNRQQRIDAASEISRIHFRMIKHERARTNLQAQVAAAVRPDRLREKVRDVVGTKDVLSAFKPIPFRASPARATDEALGTVGQELAGGEADRDGATQELGG
jgi:hypothetical protein